MVNAIKTVAMSDASFTVRDKATQVLRDWGPMAANHLKAVEQAREQESQKRPLQELGIDLSMENDSLNAAAARPGCELDYPVAAGRCRLAPISESRRGIGNEKT